MSLLTATPFSRSIFSRWVAYAKERGLGIDFNPTFFSHSMVKDGLTLSSPDETVRKFWVEHGKRCMAIAEYFAEETGKPCVINFWIPDGYKDYPADRLSPPPLRAVDGRNSVRSL